MRPTQRPKAATRHRSRPRPTPCVVRDANMGHQLAGGKISWCPELESRATHRRSARPIPSIDLRGLVAPSADRSSSMSSMLGSPSKIAIRSPSCTLPSRTVGTLSDWPCRDRVCAVEDAAEKATEEVAEVTEAVSSKSLKSLKSCSKSDRPPTDNSDSRLNRRPPPIDRPSWLAIDAAPPPRVESVSDGASEPASDWLSRSHSARLGRAPWCEPPWSELGPPVLKSIEIRLSRFVLSVLGAFEPAPAAAASPPHWLPIGLLLGGEAGAEAMASRRAASEPASEPASESSDSPPIDAAPHPRPPPPPPPPSRPRPPIGSSASGSRWSSAGGLQGQRLGSAKSSGTKAQTY